MTPRQTAARVAITLAAIAGFALALDAGDADAQTPRLNHLRPIAARTFPAADQRCGHVGIRVVPQASLPRRGSTHPEALAYPTRCLILVAREPLAAHPRAWTCALLTHEFGHLDFTTGRAHDPRDQYDHSRNPRSIMYGGYFNERAVPACNWIAWAEEKLAALADRAAALRRIRSRSRSSTRRASINARLASVKYRAAALRRAIGP